MYLGDGAEFTGIIAKKLYRWNYAVRISFVVLFNSYWKSLMSLKFRRVFM